MNLLVCIDIDATISDAGWRNKLAGPEPARSNWKKYKRWLNKIQSKKMLMKDKPVLGMLELTHLVQAHAVYVTARQNTYRKVTEKWLRKNGFPKIKLYMRPKKCKKASGDYKEDIIKGILEKSKTLLSVIIIDDDPKGCIFEAAKRNGWVMLKALSGS